MVKINFTKTVQLAVLNVLTLQHVLNVKVDGFFTNTNALRLVLLGHLPLFSLVCVKVTFEFFLIWLIISKHVQRDALNVLIFPHA